MNRSTILVVEDDPNKTLLLALALGEHSRRIRTKYVYDAHEAVSYFIGEGQFADREQYPFPALVVIDLRLPDFSGLALLYWIRQQVSLAELPVVLISAIRTTKSVSIGRNTFMVQGRDSGDVIRLLETGDLLATRALWEPLPTCSQN